MNRAKENNLWNWLRGAEKVYGADLHMERVENGAGTGTPDMNGVLNGKYFEIELKSVPRRPFGIQCELLPAQAMRLRARARAGGSCWVLIQVGINLNAKRYLVHAGNCIELTRVISEERLREINVLKTNTTAQTIIEHVSYGA